MRKNRPQGNGVGHALREESERICARAVTGAERVSVGARSAISNGRDYGGREDAAWHLDHLAESIDCNAPELFTQYVRWAREVQQPRGVPEAILADSLRNLGQAIRREVDPGVWQCVQPYIDDALGVLHEAEQGDEGGAREDDDVFAVLRAEYLSALLAGERQGALRLILDALDNGATIREIYLEVFQRSQYEVGRRWQRNELSIAQEHYCTAATQLIMSQLYPRIFATEKVGRAFVGMCAGGELHEIGVRMVADFFELDGWDTYYLGASLPPEEVVESAIGYKADLIGLSATMTFHLPQVRGIVNALRANEATAGIPILVGGYPFINSDGLWRQVGADAWAADAQQAVEVGNELIRRGGRG